MRTYEVCAHRQRHGNSQGLDTEQRSTGGIDALAGDPAGVVRGHKSHDVGDIRRLANPVEHGERPRGTGGSPVLIRSRLLTTEELAELDS